MTRKKKRQPRAAAAAAASTEAATEAAPAEASAPRPARRDWGEIGRCYALLFASAVLMFLGFAGFGIWPLAFVGMIPALWVMDEHPVKGWAFFRRALFFGYVAWYGGFYWVADTIADYGGFPYALAAAFASVYFLYQALQYVLVLWLYRRARERGFGPTLSLVVAFVAVEAVFPHLFDNFYGNSFHMLPYLVQVADLGGPLLLSAIAMLGNGALYELVRALARPRERWPRLAPALFAGALAAYLGYGAFRIAEVEERMAAAPARQIGVVQINMGIFEMRDDRGEVLRRHLEQSLELERQGPLDLLVWPESSVGFGLPRTPGAPIPGTLRRALEFYRLEDPGFPAAPLLFGGQSAERGEDRLRHYNTAFLTDAEGRIADFYDKTYLLAFGEYLPFGETFPILHEWSPHSGRFTPGDRVHALRLGDDRIGALVCYEDILPRFVRSLMREDAPHMLVNITNDGWFGDTHEPWVHLALAKMRAVEHHRYLVRATLTGVSAIVDPLGRVVTHSETYERASLRGEVRMMEGTSVYQHAGDWPGWIALAAMAYLGLVGRRGPREAPTPAEASPARDPARREEDGA
ncbi:MAG: apolipoprotein N-acyltransferase [Sandaracinaceae bacterium]|nr:apolipoprotein N-acyltransferase [Sandaracinaceae bacterium]